MDGHSGEGSNIKWKWWEKALMVLPIAGAAYFIGHAVVFLLKP